MNKIHIFSTARSGTHYLESLISGMRGIPIVPSPFEERDDENSPGSQELINNIIDNDLMIDLDVDKE